MYPFADLSNVDNGSLSIHASRIATMDEEDAGRFRGTKFHQFSSVWFSVIRPNFKSNRAYKATFHK